MTKIQNGGGECQNLSLLMAILQRSFIAGHCIPSLFDRVFLFDLWVLVFILQDKEFCVNKVF
jgi:hypothetical protein